ncbi:glycosyltransferase family 4 protein [Bradyrhizobium sp. USDA 4469]
MKINFVLPPLNMSGGIKVATLYAHELAGLGHSVTIVSPPPKMPSALQKLKLFASGRGWPTDSHAVRMLADSSGGVNQIVLDRSRPVADGDVPDGDAVIATWWETAEWVTNLSKSKGKKFYFIQGHEVFPYLPIERCRATYRLPLHQIVVSRWLRDIMEREYGNADVDIVPNSVNRDVFFAHSREKQRRPTVGTLYSSASMKRVDLVIDSLDRLQSQISDLRIIVFGAEQPNGQLSRLKNVEFFLRPDQPEIRKLYSCCDVWVSGSQSEGFNLTTMEAMACGTPVVATPTGWPFEALQSYQNGMLVDFDNAQQMTSAIAWILQADPTTWKMLSQNAERSAAHGSWAESSLLFESALLRATSVA